MKKSNILILTLLVCLAFIACKRNQDSEVQLDNNPADTESENVKDADDNVNANKDIDTDDGHLDMDNEITKDVVNKSDFALYYYVIGDVVRMREDASLESNTLDLLSKGTSVEYIDRKGEWINVKYDNIFGYIRNDLLCETNPIEETVEEVIEETDNSIEVFDNPKIIVKNSDRILQQWDGDTLRASYPIG